jgi:hypothetical protein
MLKKIKAIFFVLVFAMAIFGTVVAASPVMRELAFGVRVSFNGAEVSFAEDSQPFIMGGRTFLPVRAIADLVGLDVDFVDGVVILSERGPERDAAIVGRWEILDNSGLEVEFLPDGTVRMYENGQFYEYDDEEILWHTEGDILVLTIVDTRRGRRSVDEEIYTFSINGDILILEDIGWDDTIVLRRVGTAATPTVTPPSVTVPDEIADALLGRWIDVDGEGELEFLPDGTLLVYDYDEGYAHDNGVFATWRFDGDLLLIIFTEHRNRGVDMVMEIPHTFSIDGDILTLEDISWDDILVLRRATAE